MKLSRELKTGIIVVGGLLLFILGFSFLKATPLFDNSKTFYAVYKHVGGLQSGTTVSINGLAVGSVKSINFKDNSGYLLVTFSVSPGLDFSRNSIAELYDTGIIGGKGIQIVPVFDGAPMAANGDTLRTAVRPGLTDIVQQKLAPLQLKVEGAVSNADSLLMSFNDVLDAGTRQNLRESIAGLKRVVSNFEETSATLNTVLKENKSQIDSSISNINTISSNFAMISDSLAQAGLDDTMKNLDTAISNLNQVIAGLQQGEGSLGKLMKDQQLYDNLTQTSKELELLLQDFRLNPKRYVNVSVFGKKQKDYQVPENDPTRMPEEPQTPEDQ